MASSNMVEGRNEDERHSATRTSQIFKDSPARLSMLIKISETRNKKEKYMHTIKINTFWAGKLTAGVTGLIWPAVIPTVCKIPGDNVLEFYEWTDTESMSIWLTRSLSQSPTDVKSRSFCAEVMGQERWWTLMVDERVRETMDLEGKKKPPRDQITCTMKVELENFPNFPYSSPRRWASAGLSPFSLIDPWVRLHVAHN